MTGARLIVRPGEGDEEEVELAPGEYTIGRTQQNDVFVLHKSLSRQHARLRVSPAGEVTITDLDSKNGTFVDGVRIEETLLGRRHYLKCGDVVFSYINEDAPISAREGPQAVVDPTHDPLRQPLETMLSSVGTESLHLLPPTSRAQETLRVLLKVSEILASPGDLDDVLVRTLELIFQLLDVDRASVLLGGPGEVPVPRVARRRDGQSVGQAPFSRRIVDYVVGRRMAALFADVRSDVRIAATGSIAQQSIAASMCAPLLTRDQQPIGVIYVDRLEPSDGPQARRYGQADLEFLSAFAHQVAIAIDNAGLRKRLEQEALRRSTLQRFFPPTTIDVLMKAGGDVPVTETPATVVFCDISGYTALCARRSPREVIAFLNAYFPAVVAAVVAHEGTLEKYIGDALLAIWGAPIRRADDAARAVAAALDMQRAVAELNSRFRQTGRFEEIAVHIGVATGPVAAGNIGSSQYVQYATVGEVTTVASRICGVAGPGEVLIDAATRERLGEQPRQPQLQLEALPPTTVRGHPRALELFRVVSGPHDA